jgi:vacuolar-type H+-ATPase subunit H
MGESTMPGVIRQLKDLENSLHYQYRKLTETENRIILKAQEAWRNSTPYQARQEKITNITRNIKKLEKTLTPEQQETLENWRNR